MRRNQFTNASLNVVTTSVAVRFVVGGILRAAWQQLCASFSGFAKHQPSMSKTKHRYWAYAWAAAEPVLAAGSSLAGDALGALVRAAHPRMQPAIRFVGTLS